VRQVPRGALSRMYPNLTWPSLALPLPLRRSLDKAPGRSEGATSLPHAMDPQPDVQALMAAYANGNDQVCPALFRAIAPRLLGFLRRSTRDAAQCDDLLQLTMVRLHAARDRYRPGAPVWPWLFTIAARVRIDELRKQHRRPQAGAVDVDHIEADDSPAHGGAALDQSDRDQRVRAALDALPESHRVVIQLHRFEGLTFPQIGEALGITAGAARIRAFRAYALLREQLLPLMEESS
jgi:RNA polymerase sigma-70 factor (ECF subfamily)